MPIRLRHTPTICRGGYSSNVGDFRLALAGDSCLGLCGSGASKATFSASHPRVRELAVVVVAAFFS